MAVKHGGKWEDKEKESLADKMAHPGRKSPSQIFKIHAKQYGRTPAAVYAHWHNKNKDMGGEPPAHKPPQLIKQPSTNKFDAFISKLESVTGHTFKPSEITEISDYVRKA